MSRTEPRREAFTSARAAVLLALTACNGRTCNARHASTAAIDAGHALPAPLVLDRERCRSEVAHASVATAPGLGAIDALTPTCGADDKLVVWTMRGHTLSRLVRSRAPGATFALAEVVATGADRLGPIAVEDTLGPIAWRSPTVAIDEVEGDEWWAAALEPRTDAANAVRSGSVLMPPGAVGLGIIAPIERTPTGIAVLATVARTGRSPSIVRHVIRVPSEEVETLATDPVALTEGELKAWEPTHRVALAFGIEADGRAVVRAFELGPAGLVERGRREVQRRHVLVVPRGVAIGQSTLFAMAEFDVVDRRNQPGCIALDESLCVAPGPLTVLRVDAQGVRAFEVAPQGLPDTLGLDDRDRALLLYVGASNSDRAQRAARVDTNTGAVESVRLVPSDDLPPLDHPALVRCGREPWLVAEVLISEGGDAAALPRESAVIALPFGCIAQR